MELSVEELAKLVQDLLNKEAQERKKKLWEERKKSDDFIKDVHEAYIGIDPDSFKIISTQQLENGDTIITYRASGFQHTPYKRRTGGDQQTAGLWC